MDLAAIPKFKSFCDLSIKHLRLVEAFDRLQDLHTLPNGEHVILLVGPTGAGKSLLLNRLYENCMKENLPRMEKDKTFIPNILMKVTPPTPRITGKSDFDWPDLFRRFLAHQPEVDFPSKGHEASRQQPLGVSAGTTRPMPANELRRKVEGFVRERSLRQVLLDEAGHIFNGQGSNTYHLHFQVIKSLSVEFQRPLLLSGTYDLLKATSLNGQLARRIDVVHFSRYREEDFDSVSNPYGQSFRDVIYTLLMKLPIDHEDGLEEHLELFYLRSLGCVGILKDWFVRALRRSLQEGAPMLSLRMLEKSSLPVKQLMQIQQEIRAGEFALEDMDESLLKKGFGGNLDFLNSSVEDKSEPKTLNKKRRVGTRNPSRDPVGMNNAI